MAQYLNLAQIEAVAMNAGATPWEAARLAAIAMAESGGSLTAHNPKPPDDSYGLWQINMLGQMGQDRLHQYGIGSKEALFDPNINAMAALKVLRGGGWDQWTTFTSGAYRSFIDAAHAALPRAHTVNVSKLSFGANSSATASRGTARGPGAAVDAAPDAGGPSLSLQELEKTYGAVAALLKDTQLQHLVQQAVAQGWDDDTFTHKLYDTAFYKHHSDAQRNWLLLWNGPDHGEARAELHKQFNHVARLASQLGVSMGRGEIHDLAWKSLYLGFDDTQLQTAVGHHFNMTKAHAEGQAGNFQDQYAQMADAYGLPISHATLGHWIKGSLTGRLDAETIKAHLIDQAKSMYPGLAKQLDGGQTVADVASVYRDSMSNLLELDPTQLSWRDPSIKKALQFQSDPTKPSTLMPLYQFEQQVRSDPRWLNTNNAHRSFQDTGIQILKDMGLA